MLEECLSVAAATVYTIWVTKDDALKQKVLQNEFFFISYLQVSDLCERVGNKHYVFVSCPEVLLGAMAQATVRELNLRGVDDFDEWIFSYMSAFSVELVD